LNALRLVENQSVFVIEWNGWLNKSKLNKRLINQFLLTLYLNLSLSLIFLLSLHYQINEGQKGVIMEAEKG